MASLLFELLAFLGLGGASYYWVTDMTDLKHWLFLLLFSVIMLINAIRYEK
jgi:hypothetical protein